MPASTTTYICSHITQEIPTEILQLAFKPRQYNTTIEQRIISEIIEGPILLDTNLVGGKRRQIFLQQAWQIGYNSDLNMGALGQGVQGAYYKVPPEARENRNISSVLGLGSMSNSSIPGSSYNGTGFGNTATGLASQMLNTYTFAQYPPQPQVTLEGTNIIRLDPGQFLGDCLINVMLEHDSEFLNMQPSAILALCDLCLCAVQRYIFTKLRVTIDETEVTAGMEIGSIKELVMDYGQKAEHYHEFLVRLKGAMTYDTRSIARIIRYAL